MSEQVESSSSAVDAVLSKEEAVALVTESFGSDHAKAIEQYDEHPHAVAIKEMVHRRVGIVIENRTRAELLQDIEKARNLFKTSPCDACLPESPKKRKQPPPVAEVPSTMSDIVTRLAPAAIFCNSPQPTLDPVEARIRMLGGQVPFEAMPHGRVTLDNIKRIVAHAAHEVRAEVERCGAHDKGRLIACMDFLAAAKDAAVASAMLPRAEHIPTSQ